MKDQAVPDVLARLHRYVSPRPVISREWVALLRYRRGIKMP